MYSCSYKRDTSQLTEFRELAEGQSVLGPQLLCLTPKKRPLYCGLPDSSLVNIAGTVKIIIMKQN